MSARANPRAPHFYATLLLFGITSLHPELPLLELPRFHLLNRRLVIRSKGDGRQIGGKPPRSYPSRTSARPTTRPIPVSNPISCPACDHTTPTVVLVRPKVSRAIHVPPCRSFPINCASLDRRPYQVAHSFSTIASPKRPDQSVLPFAPQSCWARLTAIVLPVQTSRLDPYQ
jgi:hypothetical protein